MQDPTVWAPSGGAIDGVDEVGAGGGLGAGSIHLTLDDATLFPGEQLRLRVRAAGSLWGERPLGSAVVSLRSALSRPGLPFQYTIPVPTLPYTRRTTQHS